MVKTTRDSAGIQSIEVGVPLLAAFSRSPEAMTLTDLAKASEMTTSKAHKYLASFVRAGLVARDPASGRYRLGSLALELGFAAVRHLSAVSISEAAMLELRDTLNLTVSLTVWGNQGPTIVRRVESHQSQFAVMRMGSVLPLLTSNNGRIFLAYLDRRYTQQMIDAELAVPDGPAARAGVRTKRDVELLIAEIRVNRVANREGIVSGFVTMSAPIFDISNTVAAALTLVGLQDVNLSHAKPMLLAVADRLSRQLGATCVPPPPPVPPSRPR
jgi:DNA-binding IclR family transcriptional regulator